MRNYLVANIRATFELRKFIFKKVFKRWFLKLVGIVIASVVWQSDF
ncbi:MAG: hypothetical protein V4642_04770 [Bacteroidota bacterium]